MIKETTPQIPLTITRTSIFTGFAALLAVGLGFASGASAQVQLQTPAGTFTSKKSPQRRHGEYLLWLRRCDQTHHRGHRRGWRRQLSRLRLCLQQNRRHLDRRAEARPERRPRRRRVRLSRRARPRQPARDRLYRDHQWRRLAGLGLRLHRGRWHLLRDAKAHRERWRSLR